MTRPPVASMPRRKPRRLTFSMATLRAVMSRSRRCRLDGGGDPLIAPTATDVAAHHADDLGLGRIFAGREQGRRLHDLPGLAIAALWDIEGAPGLLHRMVAIGVEPFDRHHRAAVGIADCGDAGAGCLAVDVDRAGAAQ